MLKVAVIIPCFNSGSTIAETLESLIPQIMIPEIVSVIIADDYSKDNTLQICQSYTHLNEKLIIFSSDQNQGERRNINRILPYLKTEQIDWFMILHSDDLAKPGWVQENLNGISKAEATTASICSSWDDWYPQENRVKVGENKSDIAFVTIEGTSESVVGTFRQGCWWHVSGCAIKVGAFEESGGFAPDLPQLGDFDWLLKTLAAGWSIYYIPRALIMYRQHPHSISSNSFRNDRDIQEFLGILSRYLSYLKLRTFIWLWRQKLETTLRRLVRSILLRDLKLVRRRIKTLFLLNFRFSQMLVIKLFS